MYKFNQDNHKNISTNNIKKEKSTAKLSIQIWYISVVLTNHIGCFRLDRHFKENDTVEENLPSNIGKLGKQLFYQVVTQVLYNAKFKFYCEYIYQRQMLHFIGTPGNEEQRDLMLDKVLATCSRVEQRLSEKRKVIENISSEGAKASHMKLGTYKCEIT